MPRQAEKLTQFAQDNRAEMTTGEAQLWNKLRGRRFGSLKWRRQLPIDTFIVDFACFELRIILELDGISHCGNEGYDLDRQHRLEAAGWLVVRFSESRARNDLKGLIDALNEICGLRADSMGVQLNSSQSATNKVDSANK